MNAEVMFRRFLLGLLLLILVAGCHEGERTAFVPAPPPPSSPSPPTPLENAFAPVSWSIPKLPDWEREIEVPPRLFALTREEKKNSARLIERLQSDSRVEWRILVLDYLPRGHSALPHLANFIAPSQDRLLTDFFNSDVGRKLTVWDPGSGHDALAQFLPPDWDGKNANAVVLLSAAADPLTILHELLHGFYLRTQQAVSGFLSVSELRKTAEDLVDRLGESDSLSVETSHHLELGATFYVHLAQSLICLEEAMVHKRVYVEAKRLSFPLEEAMTELLPITHYLDRFREHRNEFGGYLDSWQRRAGGTYDSDKVRQVSRALEILSATAEKLQKYVESEMP